MDKDKEIEEMKKTNWFSSRDTELISEKRRDFQAAINRSATNIRDYRDYIRFEEMILRQIQVKARGSSGGKGDKLIEIVKKRLKNLYDTALSKYQSDHDLYLSYFIFCKRFNLTQFATDAVKHLIKISPNDPEIWHTAVDYLSNDLHQLDVAIKVVQRALQIHTKCEKLYLDVISLHLRLIESQNCYEVDDPSGIVRIQQEVFQDRLKPIINVVFENLDTSKFLLKLLDTLKEYIFAKEIEKAVIERLKDSHLKDEAVAPVVVKYLREHNEFKQALEVVNELLKTNKDHFLFEEAIRLELLLFKDNLFTSESEQIEAENNCREKVGQHVDDLCCVMSNFEFLLKILSVLEPYEFTKSIQQKIITKLTSEHPDKEIIWLSLAQSLKNNDEINGAIKVLHSAINVHKDSSTLITELIESELNSLANWDKDKPKDDENRILKEKECHQNIDKCIKMVLKNAKDYNFLITLLTLLTSYDFTKDIQNKIIDTLIKSFSGEEMVWHYLAQRERKGVHYGASGSTSGSIPSTKSSLCNCIQKYEEGLKKVSDSKKYNLWMLYLNCLTEIQDEDSGVAAVTKTSLLKAAFEQAHRENCLTEKYYITWLQYLSDQEIPQVLEKATAALPQSVKLWEHRLNNAIIDRDEMHVKRVFKMGVLSLKEKALPLWFMIIGFYCLSSNNEVIDAIYTDGIRQPSEVSQALKPRYIEWMVLVKGISKTRKQYNLLAYEEPFCKELHKVMANLESIEINTDFEMWELPHQIACKQFGKDHIDVWLNYIKFYLLQTKMADIDGKIQNIYSQATNTLSPLLLSVFKKSYIELLSINCKHYSSLLPKS